MLRASGCQHVALNTHTVFAISRADDLPVGYGEATFGSVRRAFSENALVPVLNINHPTTATEASRRARRACRITGLSTIKLEVLDDDFRTSMNSAVLEVARELRADQLEVWPLITPDPHAAAELEAIGCAVIRIMGSSIGSGCGIDPSWKEAILHTLDGITTPTMLDGGVGAPAHVQEALAMGFDSVLVNSCLFSGSDGPVTELKRFAACVGPSRRDREARGVERRTGGSDARAATSTGVLH